ncbi:MAG: type II toxin-antitoxin system VapC family toxin [Aquamicrobium sp.]|uniref:type II toxin-antitoxin system VapC family toxin n=1 Tax=Aquamicrobium sp. TaxID=1872579 RepID=UPI00349ED934|nr:type II toxin-antitoxin system VapC family toxin [Aquamicrobium sp.]MCO5156505.1 type II toxin-antitoxin system VapC family toxin [Aquamicrobium sp.]
MILVDTSVWIDHLRGGEAELARLLEAGLAATHPLVVGELAMGNLRARDSILALLGNLPQAVVAGDEEVLAYVARHRLFGIGIGYADAHLLAATQLTAGASLWTRDRRLREAAGRLGVDSGRD